jgi:hypothetical protein
MRHGHSCKVQEGVVCNFTAKIGKIKKNLHFCHSDIQYLPIQSEIHMLTAFIF